VEPGIRDEGGARFRCYICGNKADFIVQLEMAKGGHANTMLRSQQMPFYLCVTHEYLYKKMKKDLELKDYFVETMKENQ
jgi:hypothetical protein